MMKINLNAAPPTPAQITVWRNNAEAQLAAVSNRLTLYNKSRVVIVAVALIVYACLWLAGIINNFELYMALTSIGLLYFATVDDEFRIIGMALLFATLLLVTMKYFKYSLSEPEGTNEATTVLIVYVVASVINVGYRIVWSSRINQPRKAANALLVSASNSDSQQCETIAKWLKYTPNTRYRDEVLNQGRVFINAEVEAIQQWIANRRRERKAEAREKKIDAAWRKVNRIIN